MKPEIPTIQEQVNALQNRHELVLRTSGVLSRMALAAYAHNREVLNTGSPVVLGSDNGDIRFIFIAMRTLATDESIQSTYFTAGRTLSGSIDYPNEDAGINDTDYRIISELFDESIEFQQSVAPNYSLESGLLR